MATPNIVTGDDVAIPVTLKIDNATFDASGATIKARLVDTEHKAVYTAEITQNSGAAGADWANSLVVIEMAGADTDAITYQGKAILEIQVENPDKRTWFVNAKIIRGNIS